MEGVKRKRNRRLVTEGLKRVESGVRDYEKRIK